jgi:hypothetical protein
LDLTIDQVGPRYITSYETFLNIIIGAFDRAISQTHAIPQIEKVWKIPKRFFDDKMTFLGYYGKYFLGRRINEIGISCFARK